MTPELARTLAAYNRWQNDSLLQAADKLDEAARQAPRGAFFGSIHATFSHLLWADRAWLSRFSDYQSPGGGIAQSPTHAGSWDSLRTERILMDAVIESWAGGLNADWLAGELEWFSGAAGRTLSRPRWALVAHLFNHQTHHRGQIHAMLTAAGAQPGPTDLFLMPSLDGP